jgi:hypothetical protein
MWRGGCKTTKAVALTSLLTARQPVDTEFYPVFPVLVSPLIAHTSQRSRWWGLPFLRSCAHCRVLHLHCAPVITALPSSLRSRHHCTPVITALPSSLHSRHHCTPVTTAPVITALPSSLRFRHHCVPVITALPRMPRSCCGLLVAVLSLLSLSLSLALVSPYTHSLSFTHSLVLAHEIPTVLL